ncbi:MAG: hypothetical protein GX279_08345 [Clostridiaceae bacterium]|jgi:hypothetical protein|nr:hypothetical protein [Clostridiaceae bacterium]
MAVQKNEKIEKPTVVKEKKTVKKVQTDNDVKRKAAKLVVAHLKKKLPENDFLGREHITNWINDMEELLLKEEFVLVEYHEMRRNLNDVIERTVDEELRFKLRDSWYSLGKALDKKVRQR